MAFKMGQFPEDFHYRTDLHSNKKGWGGAQNPQLNKTAVENDGVLQIH